MSKNNGNSLANKLDSTVQSINKPVADSSKPTDQITPPPIVVKSPLDGSVLGEVRSWKLEEAVQAANTAKKAQIRWAGTSFSERRAIIQNWLNLLNERADEFSKILAAENGKTVYEAYMMEIISIMLLAKYFNRRVEKILRPRKIAMSLFKNRASYIHYQPRGLVLVIAPWNFPLSIPMGTVIMALLSGNAVILKPASLTPLISCRMRDLMVEAGLDPDLFQVVTGPGRIGSELISAGVVDYVNFTGSTEVGRKVAELAASKMIPSSMELGGKAPAIVLEDADIEKAAHAVVWGAFGNSGQICASVERVYVQERVFDRFVSTVVENTGKLRQGNPLLEADLDVGAMTDPSQIEVIEKQIKEAVGQGAKILAGGKRSSAGTQYFEPTIIVDVTDDMAVAREESFGPVMPIMKFSTDEEVIRRANDSPYGLLAYVFSTDRARARKIAEQIEAGTVMINETLMTHAFPETPWAGMKQSGIGRVHSDEGLLDLCQARHINYDVFPMANPVWHPYSRDVLNRFISLASLLTKSQNISGKVKDVISVIKGP